MDTIELRKKKEKLMIAQKARNLLAQEFVANRCTMKDVVDVMACVSATILLECRVQMTQTELKHILDCFNADMEAYMDMYKEGRSWISREGN